jgi:hypothetical protein
MTTTELHTKICVDCAQTKIATEFSKGKGGLYGRRSYCKACGRIRDKDRLAQPHAKRLATQATKRYRSKNKDKIQEKNRLKRLNKLLEATTGFCPHCKEKVDKLLNEP